MVGADGDVDDVLVTRAEQGDQDHHQHRQRPATPAVEEEGIEYLATVKILFLCLSLFRTKIKMIMKEIKLHEL